MNNLTHYPYPSNRRVMMGQRGAVATSQPLSTLAGMSIMQQGGSAVDAAIAMAIALTVVEPTSNGIGADAMALVWDGQLHGLNASGKSAMKITPELYSELTTIPQLGWLSVTVPGAVSAWRCLWDRWGKLPFEQLFIEAINLAKTGFPVSPITALQWQKAAPLYLSQSDRLFTPFREVFFPNDRSPKAGEIWTSPHHAETLREIAESGTESFYHGKLAKQIVNFSDATGGYLTLADLKNHQPEWVTPISTNYRDLTVWELPPNTQGIATLIALNILANFDLSQYPHQSAIVYHLQIEAMKLALADIYQHISDPNYLEINLNQLLDLDYAASRARLIQDTAIEHPISGINYGGTVYLAACDSDMMVSLIQSNYHGFGSGILIPNTGIALHNRAMGFNLTVGHPNQIGPAKKPFHTIIPGFLTKSNQAIGPFGLMGAAMQPQGHLQLIVNQADYHYNPQTALDAPRWRCYEHNKVGLESNISADIITTLNRWKHQIEIQDYSYFGKGQIIQKQQSVFIAGTEPRADGLALSW